MHDDPDAFTHVALATPSNPPLIQLGLPVQYLFDWAEVSSDLFACRENQPFPVCTSEPASHRIVKVDSVDEPLRLAARTIPLGKVGREEQAVRPDDLEATT